MRNLELTDISVTVEAGAYLRMQRRPVDASSLIRNSAEVVVCNEATACRCQPRTPAHGFD